MVYDCNPDRILVMVCVIMKLNPSDKTLEFGRDFRVMHYAGEVTYKVTGFIEKNKDTLFQDFKRLLYNRLFQPSSWYLHV